MKSVHFLIDALSLSHSFSMDSSFNEKWFSATLDSLETWNIFDLVDFFFDIWFFYLRNRGLIEVCIYGTFHHVFSIDNDRFVTPLHSWLRIAFPEAAQLHLSKDI